MMGFQPGPEDVLVLGVGNPLSGDDAAAGRVVELLKDRRLPQHVYLKDAGTPGLALPNWLDGWRSVVLVDAVELGCTPGSWRRFAPEEVRLIAQNETLSLHEPGLAEGLALTQALDLLPERIVLYGIQPAAVEPGAPLSWQVSARLPEVVDQILNDLGKCEA
jgi:hydrogenase maturation protease